MRIEIGNAPCSWGVDFADHPRNPPWSQVLDEVAAAGYSRVDLGPIGYLPTDPKALSAELSRRNLSLSSGIIFEPLFDAGAHDAILDKAARIGAVLKGVGATRLVIIDSVSEKRAATAGRAAAAPRLPDAEWQAMMALIAQIAEVARGFGVDSYLHPHAGGYIEFEDEIDRAMADLAATSMGLCVDTGHSAYAGVDPAALIRRYGPRVGHLHFKDIDPAVLAACRENATPFFEAVGRGIFCPLGKGMVDFDDVRRSLEEIGYARLGVVEQDVDPADPSSAAGNAAASLAFLRAAGIAPPAA